MKVVVYVLRSKADNARYVGMTTDLNRRLAEHNDGKNRYTKGHIPWKIVYSENCENWELGRRKEKYYKTSAGRNYINKILANQKNDVFPA
ncbi:MAG: GIY-YIG nuclease family protein [Saprospiraceae bacterium]|nr:GIY-YIG nuclease family protein [Saprospiraceae bacterium]